MPSKVYEYDGKLYCDEDGGVSKLDKRYGGDLSDLLHVIEDTTHNVYEERTVTLRYVGGEYFGNDDDKSDEETLDELIEVGYDECIPLKVVDAPTYEPAKPY